MPNFFRSFSLKNDIETFETIIENVRRDAVFKGTDHWILIFAILIASLGLNLNSSPVIIGAMLISPLMGPILGLGMGVAINDLALIRKSLYFYFLAVAISLITSTLFFLISPLREAHSEILSRTSPTFYDVLIAIFGGFAGTLAILSRFKGNVIVGVAIATALMPPLCTSGYGLATGQIRFFLGAFYLFLINTVFIALATFITARLLRFSLAFRSESNKKVQIQPIVWTIVVLTLTPSIYFAYEKVQQIRFAKMANDFIDKEVRLNNDYLLKRTIDPGKKTIVLTFGGDPIEKRQVDALRNKLGNYHLEGANLEIRQGFSLLGEGYERSVNNSIQEEEQQIRELGHILDSVESKKILSAEVSRELKIQYPVIKSALVEPEWNLPDSLSRKKVWICVLTIQGDTADLNADRVIAWLRVRLDADSVEFNLKGQNTNSKNLRVNY